MLLAMKVGRQLVVERCVIGLLPCVIDESLTEANIISIFSHNFLFQNLPS